MRRDRSLGGNGGAADVDTVADHAAGVDLGTVAEGGGALAQNNRNRVTRGVQRKRCACDAVGHGVAVHRGGIQHIRQIAGWRVNHHRVAERQQTFVVDLHGVKNDVANAQAGRGCVRDDDCGFFDQRHRKRQHRRAGINVRIARLRRVRILAPRRRDQRAVHGEYPHARLILARIEYFLGLQRRHREIGVVILNNAAVRVGQRTGVVALIIDIKLCSGQRRDPDRTAVDRAIGAARPPADGRFRGQGTLRHQGEAPVVRGVRSVVRRHRAERVKILSARAHEARPGTNRHLKLINTVGPRHGKAARTHLRVVVDGDGADPGVVEINIGRLRTTRRRTHRGVIRTAPRRGRIQGEPVARIARTHMADEKVGLDGLRGRDAPALQDATVHQIRFALVQDDRGRAHAGAVRINRHRRVVLRRHDEHADVFEEVVCQVLADRADVIRPVINRGQHTDRPGEHRPRRNRPARPRNDQRLVRRHPVAGVPQNRGRIARQRHVVRQREHRAGRQSQRIVREPRRDAMRVVAVAPDLRRRLRRIAQVGFVAVFPLIVIDHRAAARYHDGKRRGDRRTRAADDGGIGLVNLLFRHRQIEFLHQIHRPRRRRQTEPRANQHQRRVKQRLKTTLHLHN